MRTIILLLLATMTGAAQTEGVQVWAASALQKIRPDSSVQTSNLAWDAATKSITFAGARNEHIPFQVFVTTPPPPSREHPAAGGFFVEAGDLVSPAGRIPSDRVKLYLEHVVLCFGESSPVGDAGYWPDALAPLTGPFDMSAPLRRFVRTRGIWVDVVTASETPPGDYTGYLRVTRDGRLVDELQIHLTVYGFALPEETHLITYMGVSDRELARMHDVAPESARAKELLRTYHEFLYRNRMEPWFNEPLQPEISIREGEINVRFDKAAYDLYLNQWRTKRVILRAAPRELRRGAEFSDEFNRGLKSYLSQVVAYYEESGWLDRLVFNSPIDEPNSAEAYARTRRYAQLVGEAAPDVPFLATESPVTDDPEWGTLNGYVDNYAVHGNKLNRPAVKQAIHDEQARGGEITWYISCDQKFPQPNYFIDAPALDPVMVPWITARYGMNGILYWDLKYWSHTVNPWLNPVTYLSGFFCSDGYTLNGEGSLLYPGNHVNSYTGQKNVDGPVSSIRFELLREGIEDYEYLWLLRSLGDEEFAAESVRSLVVDVRAFSRNATELAAQRVKLAKRIEELAGND